MILSDSNGEKRDGNKEAREETTRTGGRAVLKNTYSFRVKNEQTENGIRERMSKE